VRPILLERQQGTPKTVPCHAKLRYVPDKRGSSLPLIGNELAKFVIWAIDCTILLFGREQREHIELRPKVILGRSYEKREFS